MIKEKNQSINQTLSQSIGTLSIHYYVVCKNFSKKLHLVFVLWTLKQRTKKCDARGNILFFSLNQYFCNVDVLVSDTITMVYSSVTSYSWLLPVSRHKYPIEFFSI